MSVKQGRRHETIESNKKTGKICIRLARFSYFCAQYHTNIQHYETKKYHCTCFGSVRAAAEPRLGTVQLALYHPGRDYRDRGAGAAWRPAVGAGACGGEDSCR